MSRQSDGGPGPGTGPPQTKSTGSTAVAGAAANNNTTNNNSTTTSSNADAAPVFQSKRPPGRPRKQVPSELILQRKKIGYFPGRPRGSVRVRRKPASLEEGVGGPASSMGSLAGSAPSPSPGGIGQSAPMPASNHTTPPAGQSTEEPELAEGLVQGALTTTTTAAIMAGPPEP
ncbi:hypothetical protein BIW11_12372 [Tropilaelaps mercedesae]|uniref:Uncharacterized protein n=1 Tax=Tropilaelaps mercedesae TaxID=418985 RepID=A0A1V9X7C0_9ACAR|nr:hypothetical protein BIW11_12372 [Tropilaelaps mercedesae]